MNTPNEMHDRVSAEFAESEVAEFLHEVHGHGPFPWQRQLARQVLAGRWPAAVDAPTGLGKTWAIDIAVLAMAASGLREQWTTPRRVFFVVDRRTVVDEAYEHASTLARKLREPRSDIVGRVRDGLAALTGGGTAARPLDVVRMRGGTTWADRWVWRPDQPCVVVGTVDQAGSRLLFRGYGVSDRMRPVDAALTGTQALVLLDEAHLARPFQEMLAAVSAAPGAVELPRVRTVTLSATSGAAADVLPFDVATHLRDEEAARRLTAHKRLAVLPTKPAGVAKSLADTALAVAGHDDVRRVLVVCNTVGAARDVRRRVAAAHADTGLLTGRSRPIDRESVAERWTGRFGLNKSDDAASAILVATQTVEVGMNIDVDALVTQECALDALIQRLGRVNRLGRRIGRAVVVSTGKDDPVYGGAAPATTEALLGRWGAPQLRRATDAAAADAGWLDVSPLSLRRAAEELPGRAGVVREPEHAPLVDDSLFEWWSRTSPVPYPDPPVAPYLHGREAGPGTVSVAWRADVSMPAERLSVPVSARECVEVPMGAFQRWWAGDGAADVADLDGTPSDEQDGYRRPALRVSEAFQVQQVPLDRLRTGDTIVVPVAHGGLDEWGWAPDSSQPAMDVADLVRRRDRYLLRVDADTLVPLLLHLETLTDADAERELRAELRAVSDALDPEADEPLDETSRRLAEALRPYVPASSTDKRGEALRTLVDRLHEARLWNVKQADTPRWLPVLSVPSGADDADGVDGADQPDLTAAEDSSDVGSAATGRRVPLDDHSTAVGARAESFARNLGLPHDLIGAVRLAGRWHDLGKLDRRFQRWLAGDEGDSLLPVGEPLAKSGVDPGSASARRARVASGYPAGMRHEALSARLVNERISRYGLPDGDEDVDPDLLVHLVAAHHGRGRPFTTSAADDGGEPTVWTEGSAVVKVHGAEAEDLRQPARFARLQRRYGPWGLVLLETIVRLADISCSREGS